MISFQSISAYANWSVENVCTSISRVAKGGFSQPWRRCQHFWFYFSMWLGCNKATVEWAIDAYILKYGFRIAVYVARMSTYFHSFQQFPSGVDLAIFVMGAIHSLLKLPRFTKRRSKDAHRCSLHTCWFNKVRKYRPVRGYMKGATWNSSNKEQERLKQKQMRTLEASGIGSGHDYY